MPPLDLLTSCPSQPCPSPLVLVVLCFPFSAHAGPSTWNFSVPVTESRQQGLAQAFSFLRGLSTPFSGLSILSPRSQIPGCNCLRIFLTSIDQILRSSRGKDSAICSSTHSFIQQRFIRFLLYARLCLRDERESSEQNVKFLFPRCVYILAEETEKGETSKPIRPELQRKWTRVDACESACCFRQASLH